MNAPQTITPLPSYSWENTLHTISKRLSHDFNNLITASYSVCDLHATMPSFEDSDTCREAFSFLKKNNKEILNYNRKTLQLYSPHPDSLRPQLISLGNFVKEQKFFIELLLPKSVDVIIQLSTNETLVKEVPYSMTMDLLSTVHSFSENYPNNTALIISIEDSRITLSSSAFETITLSFNKSL